MEAVTHAPLGETFDETACGIYPDMQANQISTDPNAVTCTECSAGYRSGRS